MGNGWSARRDGRVFDAVAADYDRSRPHYPEKLIDMAWRAAALGPGDPVVEVGCGSGQLTRSLLSRGLRVTAVEPGARLLSLAKENLDGAGPPEFLSCRFEDARLPGSRFRAVFSASAFHWVDPRVSWRKAAGSLASGGSLALIQHCALRDEQSVTDDEELLAAMTRAAPGFARNLPPARGVIELLAGVQERRENVSEVWAWLGGYDVAQGHARELFCDVRVACVPVLIEQTADELNALLRTTSPYQRLSPGRRAALERANTAVYIRLGRPIRSSLAAVLVTARRRPGP